MAKTRKSRGPSRKFRKSRKGPSTRKGKRAASPWNLLVKRTFDEMRRKDKSASFGDALKEASARKKRGQM